ncbi:uncharacterized protein V1518DRAFT_414173 [Limtongia smithiae]|uniref:uncharacterized protein n=1 Tax=Limtongia smithiae TaxID=1125753 RepID=UPI0034CFB7AD
MSLQLDTDYNMDTPLFQPSDIEMDDDLAEDDHMSVDHEDAQQDTTLHSPPLLMHPSQMPASQIASLFVQMPAENADAIVESAEESTEIMLDDASPEVAGADTATALLDETEVVPLDAQSVKALSPEEVTITSEPVVQEPEDAEPVVVSFVEDVPHGFEEVDTEDVPQLEQSQVEETQPVQVTEYNVEKAKEEEEVLEYADNDDALKAEKKTTDAEQSVLEHEESPTDEQHVESVCILLDYFDHKYVLNSTPAHEAYLSSIAAIHLPSHYTYPSISGKFDQVFTFLRAQFAIPYTHSLILDAPQLRLTVEDIAVMDPASPCEFSMLPELYTWGHANETRSPEELPPLVLVLRAKEMVVTRYNRVCALFEQGKTLADWWALDDAETGVYHSEDYEHDAAASPADKEDGEVAETSEVVQEGNGAVADEEEVAEVEEIPGHVDEIPDVTISTEGPEAQPSTSPEAPLKPNESDDDGLLLYESAAPSPTRLDVDAMPTRKRVIEVASESAEEEEVGHESSSESRQKRLKEEEAEL